MELLIGYSALGFISGFCFDIVVFFFGRNCLHGVLFDAILIGTPIIFALLGVFLYVSERLASKTANGFKALRINILTILFSLLGGVIAFGMGITDSFVAIIIFGLIGAFIGLAYIRPRRIWNRSKSMAVILPLVTGMTVSFYAILIINVMLVFAVIALLFICMAFNDVNAIGLNLLQLLLWDFCEIPAFLPGSLFYYVNVRKRIYWYWNLYKKRCS